MELKINKKFEALFRDVPAKGVRYIIVTGGRGSGKSFGVSTALVNRSYIGPTHQLFTRYTMTSADISIIPEFTEKIEMLGLADDFIATKKDIFNRVSGSVLMFRGLKTSSGTQTANLKSLTNCSTWVLDEAEEMVDEDSFDKIDLSLRKKGMANLVIMILNPTDVNHFIYRKFFKENGVPDVWTGIKGEVMYIHTTYLENLENLDESFIARAEKCKQFAPEKYRNVFLGHWSQLAEGRIYNGWKRIQEDQFPVNCPCWYGIDWGFANDPMAIVRVSFDKSDHTVYIKQLCYEVGRLTSHAASVIRKDILNRKTLLYESEKWSAWHWNGKTAIIDDEGNTIEWHDDDSVIEAASRVDASVELKIIKKELFNVLDLVDEVYCDPARPEQIYELKAQHGINAVAGKNTDKVGRIEYLKYFKICYIGNELENEYKGYMWQQDKKDKSKFINVPMDGNDHLMDAISYGAVTHLRRLRISNEIGED